MEYLLIVPKVILDRRNHRRLRNEALKAMFIKLTHIGCLCVIRKCISVYVLVNIYRVCVYVSRTQNVSSYENSGREILTREFRTSVLNLFHLNIFVNKQILPSELKTKNSVDRLAMPDFRTKQVMK